MCHPANIRVAQFYLSDDVCIFGMETIGQHLDQTFRME